MSTAAAQARQNADRSGYDDGDIVGGKVKPGSGISDLPGSPYATDWTSTEAIVVSADGKRVFVADYSEGALRALKVAKNGRLTESPGSARADRLVAVRRRNDA